MSTLFSRTSAGGRLGLPILVLPVLALSTLAAPVLAASRPDQGTRGLVNPDTLWIQDWDTSDWFLDWSVTAGSWQVGEPTAGPDSAYSRASCAATILAGNYPPNASTRLVRHTAFTVPDNNPRLRFWHWFSFAGGDGGRVQVSTDSGASWTTISATYGGSGGGVWTRPSLDLSQYAGLSVQLAFLLTSDSFSGQSAGWYLDDVAVVTGPFKSPIPGLEDWETGLGDWAAEAGTWEVGTPGSGPGSAHSPVRCAATRLDGNYPANADTRVISPPFTVPADNPRLRFWHWFSFAGGDGGLVQVSTDDGASWTSISDTYRGSGGGVWTRPSLDLGQYAGLGIRIAFLLTSDSFSGQSAGWYIDDVEVVTGPLVFNNPEDWEAGLGDWAAGAGTWEVGTPASGPGSAHSPVLCAATRLDGDYPANAATRLISPPFTVPAAPWPPSQANPRLRFWHWFSFAGGDGGSVQVSTDDGATWTAVSDTYHGSGGGVWTRPSIDLSQYAGLSIRIAFLLTSDSFSGQSAGWYIDDVEVVTGLLVFNNPEDWENGGLGDWAAEAGTWQVGTPASGPASAHSPVNCAGTRLDGNYPANAATRLISPRFNVDDVASNPRLQFWHWFSFAGGDGGTVQIRVGVGEWETIAGPYNGTSGGIWSPVPPIDLTAYAGATDAQIAFLFTSDGFSGQSTGWYVDDIVFMGVVGIRDPQPLRAADAVILLQNHPNPFNPSTSIRYVLPASGRVRLAVYDVFGRLVNTLVDQLMPPGEHRIRWNGESQHGDIVPSGTYFYQLRTVSGVRTKRMLMLR